MDTVQTTTGVYHTGCVPKGGDQKSISASNRYLDEETVVASAPANSIK